MINKKIMLLVLCFAASLFVWGCAEGLKNEKRDAFFDKWTTLAENSQGHSPSAQPRKIDTSALIAKQDPAIKQQSVDAKKLPSSPIHLTMRQADLKAVLRAMAKSVNMNLLVNHFHFGGNFSQ